MEANSKHPAGLRIIKTARDEESINEAAKSGFMPLIKKLEPSPKIQRQYSVIQNKRTGQIEVLGDVRDYGSETTAEWETVIDWSYYYPYNFESAFAAYLIPKDIQVGERVWLEDLIEDLVGISFQSNHSRLEGCEAIWNGSDFDVDYHPLINGTFLRG